jgi:hypothetical protein
MVLPDVMLRPLLLLCFFFFFFLPPADGLGTKYLRVHNHKYNRSFQQLQLGCSDDWLTHLQMSRCAFMLETQWSWHPARHNTKRK